MKSKNTKVYTCSYCDKDFLNEKECEQHEVRCKVIKFNENFKKENNYRTNPDCYTCIHCIINKLLPTNRCELMKLGFFENNEVQKYHICDEYKEGNPQYEN